MNSTLINETLSDDQREFNRHADSVLATLGQVLDWAETDTPDQLVERLRSEVQYFQSRKFR